MRAPPSLRLLAAMILWAAFFLIAYASESLFRLKLGRPELHTPFATLVGATTLGLTFVLLRAARADFIGRSARTLALLAAVATGFGLAALLTLG